MHRDLRLHPAWLDDTVPNSRLLGCKADRLYRGLASEHGSTTVPEADRTRGAGELEPASDRGLQCRPQSQHGAGRAGQARAVPNALQADFEFVYDRGRALVLGDPAGARAACSFTSERKQVSAVSTRLAERNKKPKGRNLLAKIQLAK